MFFTCLNTGRQEDFVFSVLNTTYLPADIQVELFFEDGKHAPIYSKHKVRARGIYSLNCAVDGIPENAGFGVRLISSLPVVITHKEHKESYHSSVIA